MNFFLFALKFCRNVALVFQQHIEHIFKIFALDNLRKLSCKLNLAQNEEKTLLFHPTKNVEKLLISYHLCAGNFSCYEDKVHLAPSILDFGPDVFNYSIDTYDLQSTSRIPRVPQGLAIKSKCCPEIPKFMIKCHDPSCSCRTFIYPKQCSKKTSNKLMNTRFVQSLNKFLLL